MLSPKHGKESIVSFAGIDSQQLSLLTAVLDEHCASNGIPPDSIEREEAAQLVISLYQQGWRTPDELKLALSLIGHSSRRR